MAKGNSSPRRAQIFVPDTAENRKQLRANVERALRSSLTIPEQAAEVANFSYNTSEKIMDKLRIGTLAKKLGVPSTDLTAGIDFTERLPAAQDANGPEFFDGGNDDEPPLPEGNTTRRTEVLGAVVNVAGSVENVAELLSQLFPRPSYGLGKAFKIVRDVAHFAAVVAPVVEKSAVLLGKAIQEHRKEYGDEN